MAGVLVRGAVEQAVDVVIALGVAVADAGAALQDVVEQQLAQQAGLLGRGHLDVADLACDVALFVGEEEPQVAIAADQALLLEPAEALLDLALEGQLVGVDAIDAERGEVVDVGFDDVGDVADEEQGLEQQHVEGFERAVVGRLVDRALGDGVDEALDRRVEVVQRDEQADVPIHVAHCGGLEGVEQRALAT